MCHTMMIVAILVAYVLPMTIDWLNATPEGRERARFVMVAVWLSIAAMVVSYAQLWFVIA
jgi:hypothetical protein